MSTPGAPDDRLRSSHVTSIPPLTGHTVQLYEHDEALLAGLERLLDFAITAGDALVVIATEAHRVDLLERMQAKETAPPGHCTFLDAREMLSRFMRWGQPDRGLFQQVVGGLVGAAVDAAAARGHRVLAYGEMVALLWNEGNSAAAVQLERMWNELGESQPFYLHCAYPVAYFGGGGTARSIAAVCGEHSRVIPSEQFVPRAVPPNRANHVLSHPVP